MIAGAVGMFSLIIALVLIIVALVAWVLYKKHSDRSLLKHIRKQTPYVEVAPPASVKKPGKTLNE